MCVVVEHEEKWEDTMYTTYKRVKDSSEEQNTKTRLCSDQCGCGPDDSFGSIRSLNSLADALHQRLKRLTTTWKPCFQMNKQPGIRKSLAHELAMIAIPFKSTEGVLNRCERNAKMAELFR